MVSVNGEQTVSMFDENPSQEVLGIIISADGGGSSVVKAEISEDTHSINWNWGENKLEKKVYEMSVITVLDKNL